MAMIRIFAVALCLSPSFAKAQAKAEISGPDSIKAGNLVVLNSVASQADASEWIFPENLAGRYIQSGDQVVFSVRESGEFKFSLVAVSVTSGPPAEMAIDLDVDSHTVTVTHGIDDPVVDPAPDDPIDSVPTLGLRELSRDSAIKLDDPPTARALARGLSQIEEGPINEMKAKSSAVVEAVLSNRVGSSRDKDWLGVWRRPVHAAGKATSSAALKSDYTAISQGLIDAVNELEATTQLVPMPVPDPVPNNPQVTVVFYTGPNCAWCEKWKRDVMPTITSWGFVVEERQGTWPWPRFEVIRNGKHYRIEGYADEVRFRKFL